MREDELSLLVFSNEPVEAPLLPPQVLEADVSSNRHDGTVVVAPLRQEPSKEVALQDESSGSESEESDGDRPGCNKSDVPLTKAAVARPLVGSSRVGPPRGKHLS